MKEISESIKNELFNPTLDLSVDYAEIAIDRLIENEILSDIPLLGTVKAFIKTGIAFRERAFLKKVLIFLSEFQKGKTSAKALQEFKGKFDKDESYRDKVMNLIILTNSKFFEDKKSIYLARLFLAYINNSIDWDRLNNLISIVDKMTLSSFVCLRKFGDNNFKIKKIPNDIEPDLFGTGLVARHGNMLYTNENCRLLYEIAIK